MAKGSQDKTQAKTAELVVVVAGAGARGAYEAGALAYILPKLAPKGRLDTTVLLGTSAGAINVSLWAAKAKKNASLDAVGNEVKKAWLGITQDRVFKQPAFTLPRLGTQYVSGFALSAVSGTAADTTRAATTLLPRFIGEPLRKVGSTLFGSSKKLIQPVARAVATTVFKEINGLLDTTPLRHTAKKVLDVEQIHRNVSEDHSVLGVGVVATTSPADRSGGRSRIFIDTTLATPVSESGSSIDYEPTPLTREHILASAAIPAAFPAVEVTTPESSRGWYIDGGVRLNAPIEPALTLKAPMLLVISSHATRYPDPPALGKNRPDVLDVGAQSIHAILADGMIEGLRRLARIELAQRNGQQLTDLDGKPYPKLKVISVAPEPGQLSKLARDVLDHLPLKNKWTHWLLVWLLAAAARGDGNNELLSYLLFDPKYFDAQFKLGEADAKTAWENWQARGGVAGTERAAE